MSFSKKEFLAGQKLLMSYESPREHYQADAAVVWCFDHRFRGALLKFIEREKLAHEDLICVAGGLKSLSSGSGVEQEFVLAQIQASIKLHNPKRIYLMLHSDCGKYGGIKNFGGDENEEMAFYIEEIKKAKEFLAQHLTENIAVEAIFADFDGVYLIG